LNITIIGTGYVGLVSGTCFSEFGHDVICVDQNINKIKRLNNGEIPIFEPGLEALVASNVNAGRLSFTTNLGSSVNSADAVFIAVGTPTNKDNTQADLSYVFAAAREIANALDGYTVVVNKSTVPVGTGRQVEIAITNVNPDANFDVVSNPEFLREGSAINDFLRPDRVVIGTDTKSAQEVMKQLYRPLFLIETPMLFTNRSTAELIKYAANAFLATKITFINEIADLCESIDADVHDVARGIGLDGRIGSKFLHAGPGYGGSCFPKDTVALAHTAKTAGVSLRIVEAVSAVNYQRKEMMANKIISACGGSIDKKTIAILGLTFKPNTDDMREAPSLSIVAGLLKAGAKVRVFDPEGMIEAKKLIDTKSVEWCDDAYDAAKGTDALTIVTEWNEFRALDLDRLKNVMKGRVMVDLRNIYDPDEMSVSGFEYYCIGRSSLPPA
jgi:UDPglucose 6-dehydrogenase